jgi:hypothetical protein
MKNIVFSFIHKLMELGTIMVIIPLGVIDLRKKKMKSRFSKMKSRKSKIVLDFISIKSLRVLLALKALIIIKPLINFYE